MIRITAIACTCAAAVALAACGSSNSTKTSASTTSSSSSGGGYGGGYSKSSSTSAKSASSSAASGSSTVTLGDNFFQPKTITGKAGATVKLTLKNTGAAEHTFTIDSQHVNTVLTAGKSATVSVKIPASGSVQFYCQFHKALGMVGTVKAA
jgi:plastocyanin